MTEAPYTIRFRFQDWKILEIFVCGWGSHYFLEHREPIEMTYL